MRELMNREREEVAGGIFPAIALGIGARLAAGAVIRFGARIAANRAVQAAAGGAAIIAVDEFATGVSETYGEE